MANTKQIPLNLAPQHVAALQCVQRLMRAELTGRGIDHKPTMTDAIRTALMGEAERRIADARIQAGQPPAMAHKVLREEMEAWARGGSAPAELMPRPAANGAGDSNRTVNGAGFSYEPDKPFPQVS